MDIEGLINKIISTFYLFFPLQLLKITLTSSSYNLLCLSQKLTFVDIATIYQTLYLTAISLGKLHKDMKVFWQPTHHGLTRSSGTQSIYSASSRTYGWFHESSLLLLSRKGPDNWSDSSDVWRIWDHILQRKKLQSYL